MSKVLSIGGPDEDSHFEFEVWPVPRAARNFVLLSHVHNDTNHRTMNIRMGKEDIMLLLQFLRGNFPQTWQEVVDE